MSTSTGTGELAHSDEDHHHTSMGLNNLKLAFWLFLGSECFFFGSLIGVYMSTRGKSLSGPYPLEVFDFAITSLSTFVLLTSSLTVALAVRQIGLGDRRGAIAMLWVTCLMGATFLGFQVYEFNHFYHEGLTLQGNIFGSAFYVLTGFHGAHVAVGILWMLSLSVFLIKRKVKGDETIAVEVAGLYWHFVDIVWIVLFTLVYLLEHT